VGGDPKGLQDLPMGVKGKLFPFMRGIDFLGIPRAIFLLFRLFKRERFNLVQYSTPNAAFYASTAAWLARVPVRIYGQWGIRYVGFQGWIRRLFKLLEIWCCKCSTVVEPDSVSNLEFSIQEGLYPRNKGRVIWNGSACGVDLERFDIEKKTIWRKSQRQFLRLEEHHLVIGFVGSVRQDKGCNELLAACRNLFEKVTEARLLLIGDNNFYNSIHEDLREWVSASSKVIHVPPTREIPKYMACMDIFSLPSYREGFGLVIVEAEAMGVPVVVSDVPGPVDAVIHEKTGMVVPVKNVELLSSALLSLLRDPEKRMVYGENAAAFARDKFEQKEFLRHVLKDKEGLL